MAEFQHVLTWSTANPLEILIGNDGGLWRSLDAIAETGAACDPSDATHFQNLNRSLGSLAEVESLSDTGISPYIMMAGLGVNGTAGLKAATAPTDQWPQILGGYGGPVVIDTHNPNNWYVNNEPGVSIYKCSDPTSCDSSGFGTSPVINDADVGADGDTMPSPAPFLVDPIDPSQLLIGTCRLWRGPASGVGWTRANAVSPILDTGATTGSCSGDALIRSIAAIPVTGGDEVVYVGMFSDLNGASALPGHILSATINPASSSMPAWSDLSANPVTNSSVGFNQAGLDISDIAIDTHDPTGKTVYATVEGFSNSTEQIETVYRSTDGGAHWATVVANLPRVPVSGVAIDPQSADTVYLATDEGVFFATAIASCANASSACWSAFGTGLPSAPVIALTTSSASASAQVLTAATYGRGVWQTPLFTVSTSVTTATATPASLSFPSQVFGTASTAQTVILKNTGSLALTPSAIAMSGDFSETDNCQGATVSASGTCSIQVTFTPTASGSRTGQMIVSANVYGGQLTVALSGTGTPAGNVSMTPAIVNFGQVPVGATSSPLQVEVANAGTVAVPVSNLNATPPFLIASNACGTTSLAANTDCQITVEFMPAQSGAIAGTLTLTDGAGTQTVQLNGTGAAPPTDLLNPTSLSFPATAVGQLSNSMPVLLTNSGDLALTSIAVSVLGNFQTSNNCGTQLAGHSTCTINAVFAPAVLGLQTGSLIVGDITRAQPQTIPLTGTGVQPATLTVNPASLTFAAENIGAASAPRTLTVANTGGVPAANIGFQFTGAASSSFTTAATTCGATLAAAATCTVAIVFSPVDAGGSAASLVVSSSTLGVKAVTVPLNGTGTAAAGLNVSPPTLKFPATVVGSSSAVQTVTISNTSSNPASQLNIAVTPSPIFNAAQTTCTLMLSPNSSCTVGVSFSPTSTGAAAGVLTATSSTIGNVATVALSGSGAVSAGISIAPSTLTFASTGVGQTSLPATVTVTNTGSLNALANLVLGASAGFQVVANTCPAFLGPGLTCTAGVEFAPTTAGAQTGVLSATSTTLPTGASAALQGNGFDFSLAPSGSATQTVPSGNVASYTLVLTPLANSAGTFTLLCDSVPAEALCSFDPASEKLAAGVTGNVVVSISTGGSSSARAFKPGGFWSMLPVVYGLLLLPFSRQMRNRPTRLFTLLIVLGLIAAGVGGCTKAAGGGSSGKGPGKTGSGTTPAGTYTIPVTVTSTGVSHSLNLTLIVD